MLEIDSIFTSMHVIKILLPYKVYIKIPIINSLLSVGLSPWWELMFKEEGLHDSAGTFLIWLASLFLEAHIY